MRTRRCPGGRRLDPLVDGADRVVSGPARPAHPQRGELVVRRGWQQPVCRWFA